MNVGATVIVHCQQLSIYNAPGVITSITVGPCPYRVLLFDGSSDLYAASEIRKS